MQLIGKQSYSAANAALLGVVLNKINPKEHSIISQQVKSKVQNDGFAFAGALPFNPMLQTVRSVNYVVTHPYDAPCTCCTSQLTLSGCQDRHLLPASSNIPSICCGAVVLAYPDTPPGLCPCSVLFGSSSGVMQYNPAGTPLMYPRPAIPRASQHKLFFSFMLCFIC